MTNNEGNKWLTWIIHALDFAVPKICLVPTLPSTIEDHGVLSYWTVFFADHLITTERNVSPFKGSLDFLSSWQICSQLNSLSLRPYFLLILSNSSIPMMKFVFCLLIHSQLCFSYKFSIFFPTNILSLQMNSSSS